MKKRRKRLGLASHAEGRKKKTQPKKTSQLACAPSRRFMTAQVHSRRSNKRKDPLKNLAVTHARIFRSHGEIKCRICGARLVEVNLQLNILTDFALNRFGFTRALYHHVTRVHCRTARKLEFSEEERASALAALYPPEHTVKRLDPKKKYVCAVCKSVCDLLGLFVHMKQVHFGLLCQYCLKLFKKV